VVRGDPATRRFVVFWVCRQHVVAGMTVIVRDVAEPIQALIRSGRDVDLARLVDPDIPIKELADRRW
jgi:3-phenylpropionate/trans-cinnamate dioxygenase ferredoxin reductase subunit